MYRHFSEAALHDLARAEAARLRHAAIAHFGDAVVDDFWRGANAVWERSLHGGQAARERSGARLQSRLARHARGRDAAAHSATPCTQPGV